MLSAAACSRPRIIPDEQLAAIFRDAYLTNAYVSREQIDTDSLKLYEPVFDRYGYTAEDVYYTIGNFSRRKSARLSDVVERAIVLLDTEGARYDHEVAVLDTIDRVARRTATRTLRTDTLLRVERLRDTSLLHFALDSIRPGDYRVTFRYRRTARARSSSARSTASTATPRGAATCGSNVPAARVRSASTTRCAAAAATRTTSARSPRAARTGA